MLVNLILIVFMGGKKMKITEQDLINPQRFVGEGLGAPEAKIMEARTQKSVDCPHCLRTPE